MNLPASRLTLCLLALLLLPTLCAAQITSSSAPAVWKPDPKLLSQLGPEVSVGDYKVRPPIGYEAIPAKLTQADANSVQHFKFRSEQRPDGSHAYFDIDVVTSKPGYHLKSLDTLPEIYAKDVLAQYTHAVKSPAEHGILGNIPAIRFYWKGVNPKTNGSLHGLQYAVLIDKNGAIIIASDREPYSKDTLPLMEAAALTFRKG